MPTIARFCLCLYLLAGWAGLARAQSWPPLDGELAGRFQWLELRGAPPLNWRVKFVRPPATGPAPVEVTLTAPGFELRIEATLPGPDGVGTWRIVNGGVQLAEWGGPALAAAGLPEPADLSLSGTLALDGSGTWQGATLAGTINVEMSGGLARSDAQKWEARELGLTAVLAVEADRIGLRQLRLTAGAVEAAGITASDLRVEATGLPDGRIQVNAAQGRIFDGGVALRPFTFDPAQPGVEATAELTGLALRELAQFLPDTLAGARGRIDGRIRAQWSPEGGFQPRAGALQISAVEPAALRLASTPGFLTRHLPERIQLLPSWLRLPTNWFAPVNPAYDTLSRIELGRQELTVEKLQVALYPDGPDGPRSAVIEVTARPEAGGAVEQVSFTVNVAGPLQQVLQLGLDERARLNFGPAR